MRLSPIPLLPRPFRARALAWALPLALALCAALAAGLARAEDADDDGRPDPPARVGSISALRGPVDSSLEAGAAWEPARLNQPVTSAASLWAPPGSQAEVRIGSTSVRLDGNTQAVFSQVDDHGVAIDVAQGTVRARLRTLPSGDRFSLSADGVRAEMLMPGDYRVAYDPDRRAYTVRSLAGRLRVVTPGNSFNLEAGQEAFVENGGRELQLRAMGQRDDFDAWAEARDRDQDRLAASRYVSPETTGIEALDEHGRWVTVPDYGSVWYPRALPYGWAPYRFGHWAYVRPWGWTWVDDAPWGFAPFHYGRWALIGGSWGWVPGPVVPRPVYAPALVGYVGAGSGNVSVSIGFGSGGPVGWFPLGPREAYYPPYYHSPRYVRQINVINVTNVVNVPPGDRRATRPAPVDRSASFRYARRPEAVTMVDEDRFRNARSIGRDRLDLSSQQVAALQPVAATLVPGPRDRDPGRDRGGAPGAPGGRAGGPGGLPTALLPQPDRRTPSAPRAPDGRDRNDGPLPGRIATDPRNNPRGDLRGDPRGDLRGDPRGDLRADGPGRGGLPGGANPSVPMAPVAPVLPQPRPDVAVPRDRSVAVPPDGRPERRVGPPSREPSDVPAEARPRGPHGDDILWRGQRSPQVQPQQPQPQAQPQPQFQAPAAERRGGDDRPARAAPTPQVAQPQPPVALPPAAPAPQALPRPVPVPVPQPMPSPNVQQPQRPVVVPQPMPPQRGRDAGDGGERRGGGDRGGDRGDRGGGDGPRGWSQRER